MAGGPFLFEQASRLGCSYTMSVDLETALQFLSLAKVLELAQMARRAK